MTVQRDAEAAAHVSPREDASNTCEFQLITCPVHFRGVQRPIADARHCRLEAFVEDLMENLQWKMRALFREPNFVQQDDNARLGGLLLVPGRCFKGLLDALTGG